MNSKKAENKRKNKNRAVKMNQERGYYKNAFLDFCTLGCKFSNGRYCWGLRGLTN